MNPLKAACLTLLLAASPAARATETLTAAPVEHAPTDTAAFRGRIAEVLQEVSAARELEPLRPVEPWLQSRDELAAYVQRQFEREDALRRLHSESRVLARFGLLPSGYSLADSLLAIYREQIGGVYDYHSDRLLLADWLTADVQTPVMAHELVHALQDQRYEIGAHLDSLVALDDDDATQAFLALAEGDATAVMFEFTARSLGLAPESFDRMTATLPELLSQMSGQAPRLAAAPGVVQRSLLFPYVQGTAFVLALRKAVPWSGFVSVYARPPASSSEILHPDRYLAGERNTARIGWNDDLTRPCCTGRYENTLGEWNLRLVLAQTLPDSVAAAAADGWIADRYLLLGAESARDVLFLATSWRNENEAREFFDAISPEFRAPPTPGEKSWIEQRGDHVVLALGDSPAEGDALAALKNAVWASVTFEEGR